MKKYTKLVSAALLVSGAALTAPAVANADIIQVDGNYATQAACQADGPHVQLAQNDADYSTWNCQQGDDGYWYLFLGN